MNRKTDYPKSDQPITPAVQQRINHQRTPSTPILPGTFIALDTADNSQCFIDISRIVFISNGFTKGDYPTSRRVVLETGLVTYVLDSDENMAKLRPLLPPDAQLPHAAPKRRRVPKPKPKVKTATPPPAKE